MSALAGKRIVITRARAQADGLAAQLGARGAHVIIFPAIEIVATDPAALDGALSRLSDFQWIAFTSTNAVEQVLARAGALGVTLPRTLRLAAVGPTTAKALEVAGHAVAFVPSEYVGAVLGRELPEVSGKRVLLPVARGARGDGALALESRGAIVSRVVVYETKRAALDADARRELTRGVDVVTFASPSAVEHTMALLDGAIPSGAVVACIGPVTGDAARAHGLTVSIEAADHSAAGLVSALDDYFGAARAARGAR